MHSRRVERVESGYLELAQQESRGRETAIRPQALDLSSLSWRTIKSICKLPESTTGLTFESGHLRGHYVQQGYDLTTKQVTLFPADWYARP